MDLLETSTTSVQHFALRPDALVSADGADCVVAHPWKTVRFTGVTAPMRRLLREIAEGWVAVDDVAGEAEPRLLVLAELDYALQALGPLLLTRVSVGGRPLVVLEAVTAAAELHVDEGPARLSPFAYLRLRDGHAVLESPLSAWRLTLAPGVIAPLFEGGEIDAADPLAHCLRATGMLAPAPPTAEFHDLLFHRHSRRGLHDGRVGATFRYLGQRPPPPAEPPPLDASPIALAVPRLDDVLARDPPLTHAIEWRGSTRRYGVEPIAAEQLAELLFRAARSRGTYGPIPEAGMPYEAGDRPYPSGGAAYELELYLAVGRVRGLDPGLYRYAAARHALERLPPDAAARETVLEAARASANADALPDVALTIGSRLDRLSWKYESIAYATTLKNVGALLQTLYLVGTGMGLAVCALGSGDSLAAARAFGLDARGELPVGELMIGSRPADPSVHAQRDAVRTHPTWRDQVAPDWARPPQRSSSSTL